MKIGILGDGLMAMAIHHLLQSNGNSSAMFSRKKGNIPSSTNMDVIFLCVPSSAIGNYISFVESAKVIVSCSKGVASVDQPFISSFLDKKKICVLSGPNFAEEILQNNQTITTLASSNKKTLEVISSLLTSKNFQIEYTDEVVGVELCGIIKNVIAIIMGYASIKMPSWNEKSLLLTKMFQEIGTILKYFNCSKSVLELSCGIGDIFLTCSSISSRNYRFGISLAKGEALSSVTVEGVRSADFMQKLPLDIPTLKMVEGFVTIQ